MTIFDHDYDQFPELTNAQLEVLELFSPHVQIKEDFDALVVRVHDGDTITVSSGLRDFTFPIRFLDIDAPELNQEGGKESGDWLRGIILHQTVTIKIDKNNRVGKFGRLLGRIIHNGIDIGQTSIMYGYSLPFNSRNQGKIADISKILLEVKI